MFRLPWPRSGSHKLAQASPWVSNATALGVQSSLAPTPVSAIEIDLYYNTYQLSRSGHFVDQKTWSFYSACNGCNDQRNCNRRIETDAAKNSAKMQHATPASRWSAWSARYFQSIILTAPLSMVETTLRIQGAGTPRVDRKRGPAERIRGTWERRRR
jgi:hypothetical protein